VIAVRFLRDGVALREAIFTDLPVRLGRDPGCEFPLLDPSVSRAHAVVERREDGSLELRDLGSRNGLWLGAARVPAVPVSQAPSGGGVRCRLGRVEIEIEPLLADAPTEEMSLADLRLERRRTAKDHVRYLVLGLGGWLAGTLMRPELWSPWSKSRGVELLGHGMGALVTLPLAAAVLLVVLKAFGRRLRFADALLAVARVVWLWPVAIATSFILYYPLTSSAHAWLRAGLGLTAFVVAVVSLVSARRRGASGVFRLAWAAAAAALYCGVLFTGSLAARRMGQPSLNTHVQPPLADWPGRTESLDAYFGRVREAAREAAADAAAVRARQSPD